MSAAEQDLRNHLASEIFIKTVDRNNSSGQWSLDAGVSYVMADVFIEEMRRQNILVEISRQKAEQE